MAKRKSKVQEAAPTDSVAIEGTALTAEVPPAQPVAAQSRSFEYKRLSASMMKTFLQCRRKFHINYIDGKKSDPNVSFTLGTAVHYALEHANKALLTTPRVLEPNEVENYVQMFREKAVEGLILSSETFEVGENLVRSELQTYNIEEKVIGVELEFELETPEKVKIYGFMDKVVELDPSTIMVVDYKTSVNPMGYDEAKVDEQVGMYDLAIGMLYPHYFNRKICLRYLRSGVDVVVTKSDSERDSFRKQVQVVDAAIKSYCQSNNGTCPGGQLNEFCNWCSYKNGCPQYADLIAGSLPTIPNIGQLTDDRFIEMWQKTSSMLSALDDLKDNLKTWASERLESDPDRRVTDGKHELYLTSGSRREYDLELLLKSFTIDELLGLNTGEPLVKINTTNFAKYLKQRGDFKLLEKFNETVTTKNNAPSYRIRKVKV